MKNTRTIGGKTVKVETNNGIRKRCTCPRRTWTKCPHPWHFSFKLRGSADHHRFPLSKYADHPIVTRRDAETERDRLRILIRNGEFPPVAPAPPTTPEALTFEQFAERWQTRARSGQSDNQQMNDKGIIKRLSGLPLEEGQTLGQRPVGLVTLDDLQLAFSTLVKFAGSTRNKYRQAILLMQRWGVKNHYLPRPWITALKDDLRRQKGAKRERRLVPDMLDANGKLKAPGEERRLLEHASPWLQRLIMAALQTGCRKGELLSLTWADVSLANKEITIRAENAKDGDQRHLPISPRLRAVLDMVQHDPNGDPHLPTAFVFGTATGEKVADPKKSWGKACKAAGVTGLRFHDLRHEAGSRMLEMGWPLHQVAEMLGHADVKTTSVYLNPTRQGLQESMRKFGVGGRSLPVLAQSEESEPPPVGNDSSIPVSNALVN